ncbi:hypothetical protein F2Q70_00010850 [Brassica cretica]|uniref:Uncharacterized protein n=1 Tax=Brassica cretica TaxID=69181 RepID=A0A8S9LYE0_BRACR|nr:hypothetical protein F2Q70_00010850 [Brassica cretica]
MPPNFDETDEKEESNDDSDDASRRVSLNEGQGSSQNGKTFGMIGYIKSPSYLNSNEKILIGVAIKGDASRRVSLNEGQGSSQNDKTFGMIEYIKSPSYLNSNEKILIGVATKGVFSPRTNRIIVVKIFSVVNKASHAQKFLNASRLNEA